MLNYIYSELWECFLRILLNETTVSTLLLLNVEEEFFSEWPIKKCLFQWVWINLPWSWIAGIVCGSIRERFFFYDSFRQNDNCSFRGRIISLVVLCILYFYCLSLTFKIVTWESYHKCKYHFRNYSYWKFVYSGNTCFILCSEK